MTSVPLISEHDTWISVDPFIGCPADCVYCYLGPLGLRAQRAHRRVTPRKLIDELQTYLSESGRPVESGTSSTPVCIGNYTDMFMFEEGTEFLVEYAALHAEAFHDRPLCVVSKARISADALSRLDAFGHPILIFMSQSFARDPSGGLDGIERGPTCRPADTAENLRQIARRQVVQGIHFWRPLTVTTVPNEAVATQQLKLMKDAGAVASVAIGLKYGNGTPRGEAVTGFVGAPLVKYGEILPVAVRGRVLAASAAVGHPVYFHTSCAIALALKRAEALGTWRAPHRRSKCLPANCPKEQRDRCERYGASKRASPGVGELERIASHLKIAAESVRWSSADRAVRVSEPISQLQQNQVLHVHGWPVIAEVVHPSLAWFGAFADVPALESESGEENDTTRN